MSEKYKVVKGLNPLKFVNKRKKELYDIIKNMTPLEVEAFFKSKPKDQIPLTGVSRAKVGRPTKSNNIRKSTISVGRPARKL